MLLTWAWIVLGITVSIATETSLEKSKEIEAFIKLTEYAYEETCNKIADANWAFIISPSNKTLFDKKQNQITFSNFTKNQRNELMHKTSLEDVLEPASKYKYTIMEKTGDTLMEEDDWNKLIIFDADALSLQLSAVYDEKTKKLNQQDVNHFLKLDGGAKDKKAVWSGWYEQLTPLVQNFTDNLQLIQKAATINGINEVREYWETLSVYPDGYEQMQTLWAEINYLHKKFSKFVQSHIAEVYNLKSVDNTIPAYLLGSLQGYDWTEIPIDLTDYQNEMHEIKKNLWKNKYLGIGLYEKASGMGKILLGGVPEAKFWQQSQFNGSCPSLLFNFCQNRETRLYTCFDASVSNFLSAHKNVAKILTNQMITNNPILNQMNRYSALEEGVSELFGILAASPAWLDRMNLMHPSTDQDKNKVVSLMITALDVLPRLAYYVSADMWRINAIEQNISNPEALVASWWKYRQEYEGVIADNSSVPSFLNDEHITRNQPYLPKFVGIILGFQLYDYAMRSTELIFNPLEEQEIDADFRKMIQQSGSKDWGTIIDTILKIDDISKSALTSFFEPLEEFIEESQEDFTYKYEASKGKELEELRNKVIREINTPSTTTIKPKPKNEIVGKSRTSTKEEIGRRNNESLTSDSSLKIPENIQEKGNSSSQPITSTKDNLDTLKTIENEGAKDDKPITNKSKAAWAVGAVLISIVIICIIAIFGQKRCRRTPKNRRYV